jgi:hypothetical protein
MESPAKLVALRNGDLSVGIAVADVIDFYLS